MNQGLLVGDGGERHGDGGQEGDGEGRDTA